MISFTTIKLMASIFTPEFTIGDKLSRINFFKQRSNNKFDGDFFSVPIPQDAPAEIPRIILNSEDNSWKLEISLQRTNLIFLKPNLLEIEDPDALNFSKFAQELFYSYKTDTDVKIQRLAYITERASVIEDKSPSQYIADKYCKDKYLEEPFNNAKQFELHSLKKYHFEGFNINSWVRLKSANLLDEQKTPIVQIINDINTLSVQEDPEANFTADNLSGFLDKIPGHLESILDLYFKE